MIAKETMKTDCSGTMPAASAKEICSQVQGSQQVDYILYYSSIKLTENIQIINQFISTVDPV
jgi:hypothetical protein